MKRKITTTVFVFASIILHDLSNCDNKKILSETMRPEKATRLNLDHGAQQNNQLNKSLKRNRIFFWERTVVVFTIGVTIYFLTKHLMKNFPFDAKTSLMKYLYSSADDFQQSNTSKHVDGKIIYQEPSNTKYKNNEVNHKKIINQVEKFLSDDSSPHNIKNIYFITEDGCNHFIRPNYKMELEYKCECTRRKETETTTVNLNNAKRDTQTNLLDAGRDNGKNHINGRLDPVQKACELIIQRMLKSNCNLQQFNHVKNPDQLSSHSNESLVISDFLPKLRNSNPQNAIKYMYFETDENECKYFVHAFGGKPVFERQCLRYEEKEETTIKLGDIQANRR